MVKRGGSLDLNNFSNILTNKYFYIAIIFLVLLIIGLVYLFKKKEHFGNEETGNSKTLEYYYMESCPHCKDFNPVWDKLSTEFQKQNIKIKLEKYDIMGAGQDRAQKFNVSGAPTILLTKNDKLVKEYTGPRTFEGLKTFAV